MEIYNSQRAYNYIRKYSQRAYFFVGVLPECLKVFLGKIQILQLLVQVSQKIIRTNKNNNNTHSGSTTFMSFKAFWELYISSNHVLISSGITPGDLSGSTTISTLGVLPENLFMFCGSNISNLYILTILIPV